MAATSLDEAYALAKKNRLRIVVVEERKDPAIPGVYVPAYVVYTHAGRLGRRRDPAELLRMIRTFLTPPPARDQLHT